MPTTIVTMWGHHLLDPELSRVASERDWIRRATRDHRRNRPRRRRWLRRSSDSLQNQPRTLPSISAAAN